jgi:hypothetical protein
MQITGHSEIAIRLTPRQRSSYRLEIEGETGSAWGKVRERVPSPGLSPVVAVSGETECVIGDQLLTAGREVVCPTQSPWFSGDVTDLPGDLLSLIDTSEPAAKASACHSSGGLFSTPTGAREFLVARNGRSHFSLKTQGSAIVLEMLRPLDASVKMYKVDSTIQFWSEVPGKR